MSGELLFFFVEHVRLDLELTTVVQHCPNLVGFRRARLISVCWSPSLLQDLLTFAAIGFSLPPASPLPA